LTGERPSLVEYLQEVVQPVLFEKLDAAFPEFGWRRTAAGWVATNRAFTKERFGVRPDRVICHRPFGFLIHGERAQTWCAYVHGGTPPQGRAFREAVASLAARAGVAPPGDSAPARARDERTDVLEHFIATARRRLLDADDPDARRARSALDRRGLGQETWAEFELGLAPAANGGAGVDLSDLRAVGLADAHWASRIVGAWRDSHGTLVAIFGRRLRGGGPKYLCSTGPRPPLFGLPLPARAPALVLVEGIFDALALRAAGVRNVVAAAGTTISQGAWSALEALGCRDLTLWFDSDEPGRKALLHAIQGAPCASERRPQLFVIHPDEARRFVCVPARRKVDPNSVVLAAGRRGVLELLARRWPARIYAALNGAEEDLDQALLGSLGATDWDLEPILRTVSHLSGDAREIALGTRECDALLEGCLESGRALRRAGVPAAHVAAEIAPRLAELAREAGP